MYNNLDWLIPKINAVKKEVAKLSNKFTQYQKKLTAGDNITIENNVISASGGGGAMMVNAAVGDYGDIILDKTFAEISSALPNVVVNLEAINEAPFQGIMPYTYSITKDNVTTLYFTAMASYQYTGGVNYMEVNINSSNEPKLVTAYLPAP